MMMRPTTFVTGLSLSLALMMRAPYAQAEYRLAAGDIVDVSVYGRAELTRRAPVDVDGRISLPLLGGVAVAGLTVEDAQAVITERLGTRDFVRGASVLVTVSEYRPVYIKGDVVAPKAYPYLPGLTVRQAIASAGGFGSSARGATGSSARLEYYAEYQTIQLDSVALASRIERMKAELDGKTMPRSTAESTGDKTAQAVARLERLQFESRRDLLSAKLASLRTLTSLTDEQLVALEQQRKQSQDSVTLQAEEVEKARGMLGRGLTTSNRLTDEQRALALLKTQLLGNIAQSAETRRLRADLDHKASETVEQRRSELLTGLQDGAVMLEKLRARGDVLARKIAEGAAVESDPRDSHETTSIVVYRRSEDGQGLIDATEDTQLWPGDVIEVKLHLSSISKSLSLTE